MDDFQRYDISERELYTKLNYRYVFLCQLRSYPAYGLVYNSQILGLAVNPVSKELLPVNFLMK